MWQKLTDPIWSVEHLRAANEAAGVALWSWNIGTDEIALDQCAHDLWGISRERPLTFDTLANRIHPGDLRRVRAAFKTTHVTAGAYEIDFRILHSCGDRWISARGQGGDKGIVDGVMLAVFLNVTGRKLADEGREMLANEMSHRIKNLFAITTALTRMAARSATTKGEMEADLTQRLLALGRAHDFIHPATAHEAAGEHRLGSLLEVLLAPYCEGGCSSGRIRVTLPAVRVGEHSVTAIALIVHELATNAVKYGALSLPGGMLDITGTVEGKSVTIVWTERGGPPLAPDRGPAGFGSKLLAQSMAGGLGGDAMHDWHRDGLVVVLRMNKGRLAA